VTTRRQFIHTSLALAALPAASAVATRASATTPALPLERFVFDSRFAAATEVARHVADRGVPLSPTAGDLTDLWYRELDLQWKRAPQPLAGITTRRGLFVLETLAADHGMRVVYRGEHRTEAGGRVSHALAGPDELLARFGVHARTLDWADLAVAMAECPLSVRLGAACELASESLPAPPRDEPLSSWIIAPRATTLSARALFDSKT
jgi:hypothetical protein